MDSFRQLLDDGGLPLQQPIDEFNLSIPSKQYDDDIDMDLPFEESDTDTPFFTQCHHCWFINEHQFMFNNEELNLSLHQCCNCNNYFTWGGLRSKTHTQQNSVDPRGNEEYLVNDSSYNTPPIEHDDDVENLSALIEEDLKIDDDDEEEASGDCDMNQPDHPDFYITNQCFELLFYNSVQEEPILNETNGLLRLFK